MLPIILFLAVPILGFIFAMKDLRRWESKFVFIAFYALYGYATSFELDTADSYRVAQTFYFGYWKLSNILINFYNGYYTDLYRYFVYVFVQQYTSNPKVLYAVFSFVYGTFACLSIAELYNIWKGKKTLFFYLIVFLFFLHLTFFNIQTTRYYTATSVFVFFAIQFLYYKRKLALIGICITPFIHFSFYFGVAVLLSYQYFFKTSKFYKYSYWIYVFAFILSLAKPQSFIDEAMGDEEQQSEMTSSSSVNRKIKTYSKTTKETGRQVSSDKKRSAYSQGKGIFRKATLFIYAWGFMLLSTLIYKKRKRKEIIQNKTQDELLNFVFYFFGMTTLFKLLFSNGGRFFYSADCLMMFWLCCVFKQNESVRWKDYIIMLFPIKFYYIAFFFFNAPRHCETMFWWATPVSTIINGIGFIPDFL